MAATDKRHGALKALMQAALMLPGIVATPASGADAGTLNLQVSRYEEGDRDLAGIDSGLKPLHADTLHLSGDFLLRNGIRAAFGLTQDTWSGATPVAVSPFGANGNRAILRNGPQGVIVAGASPMVNGRVPLDGARQPVADPRKVLVMSSASPELRRQADLSLEAPVSTTAAFTLDASLSDEPDYRSRHGRFGGRYALNQNLTTVNAGAGFTRSDTAAQLDTDLLPYLTRGAYARQLEPAGRGQVLRGERRDRAYDLGLTQVIDAASVFEAGVALTRGSGFMENPYKAVSVIFTGGVAGNANGDLRALLEQRPDERRQLAWHARYARHFAGTDGTLQLDYNQSRDDWGVDTYSLELGWTQSFGAWSLAPRLRYYTQTAADFHADWLVSEQNYRSVRIEADGNPVVTSYSPALLPAHFSSDHRLAAFGSLSAGLTVERRFARGVTLEAGFEYYTRADGLHAGSAGSAYADFDFAMANLALKVDLGASARRQRREQSAAAEHAAHNEHARHSAHATPAGLAFAHAGLARGAFMSGYRVSRLRQGGGLLHGSGGATDAATVAFGCDTVSCRLAPARMSMTMHMLDLMYALNDSTTLMLMPQYMTMDMDLRELAGRPAPVPGVHEHSHGGHASGALGDTIVAGLFTLAPSLHASVGLGMPTGKTNLAFRRQLQTDGGLMHYDMQTGSGTWDLLPALTWMGTFGAWQHGAQVNGIKRLEHRNDAGYRLGDEAQLSLWTVRTLARNLSASLRAVWTYRGAIDGGFTAFNAAVGPMDFGSNYGGRYVDLGVGVTADIAGSRLALEWLAPVHEDVSGFQLERRGTLAASWHYNY